MSIFASSNLQTFFVDSFVDGLFCSMLLSSKPSKRLQEVLEQEVKKYYDLDGVVMGLEGIDL